MRTIETERVSILLGPPTVFQAVLDAPRGHDFSSLRVVIASAALTPPEDAVTLMDENVEPIDFERCASADIVGVTGMVVQRRRMREILIELRKRGCYIVVGGPWITVSEDYFGDLVDVAVIGEAEETWPQLLTDWKAGKVARRYEQAERTDMTKVPPPRLDLLRATS